MNNRLIAIISSFCLLFCFNICSGQYADTTDSRAVIKATINNFNAAIGQQSWLYNGPNYDIGTRIVKGSPNFMDTLALDMGSVVYYGFKYIDVPLIYNIHDDLLVSVRPDGFTRFTFLPDRLTEFTLLNHRFIRLDPDSAERRVVKPGFYDNLYDDKIQVLAKRTKNIHVENSLLSVDDYYEPKMYYYLKKAGRYYSIGSEGDFLDVLKDRKKELKKYIKDNKIKFRKQPEDAMVMLATYYDQLAN